MRSLGFALLISVSVVDLALSQVIMTTPTPSAAALPKYRPILLGKGPNSLVDQIDTASLIKKGQKDAAVMFYCIVNKNGKTLSSETYRGTAGSKALQDEVTQRLDTAKFAPAIYDYKPVDAVYYGTVVFAVINGKPRLRIFSNQEPEELKKESDFIAPQPFLGGQSKFLGLHYPSGQAVEVDAVVELSLTVDAIGNLKEISVKSEKPPFLGFGETALADFHGAKFIPGFRNGQPVESKITLPVHYLPRPWGVPEP